MVNQCLYKDFLECLREKWVIKNRSCDANKHDFHEKALSFSSVQGKQFFDPEANYNCGTHTLSVRWNAYPIQNRLVCLTGFRN